MLRLMNVSANFGRLKEAVRTRLVEAGPLVLSWGAQSDRANACQSACRATLRAEGLAWDSGWIETREQRLRYEGELPEGLPVALSIRIRDDAGEESEVYESVLYNASVCWRAGWIGAPDDEPGRTVYLRREFTLTRPPVSAVLYACGVGCHVLSVNGQAVDSAALDPAVTDFSKTCLYVCDPEFVRFLRPGVNCLGAILGEGWRRNALVKPGEKPYAGAPALTAMLRLAYADGSVEWILTDENWQAGRGARCQNDLFNGETYDARLTAAGWDEAGFTGFSPARRMEAPGGVLRPMMIPPITCHRLLRPIACWPVGPDSVVADFGQNLAGVVRLRLPAGMKAGQTVRLRHAEELEEDGTLFTAPLRSARAEDVYIASGDGRDLTVYQPLLTYHGFRYVRVDGLGAGLDADCLSAVELHTDLENGSSFRCGDALVTRIHELCVATERANQHGLLTDCPQRDERQGWMNDATVRFEETPYNFDIGRMFPKVLRDLLDTQDSEGAITCTAPYVFGFRPADPVCSSFLVAGLECLLHTGNREILEETFDAFAAWENCLLAHSENGLVTYGHYGDWAAPAYACRMNSMGDGAESKVTPKEFMSSGYSYYNCRLLERFCGVLNRREEEARWREQAERIRRAMLDAWYDAQNARMCTGSQGCQAFSLWLGLLPEEDARRAARRLRDELVACDYRFTTGNLCTRYLLDVLARYGFLEEAWTLITRQEYPSWGYMIQQEATTVWERFELKKAHGMNSHNHPMYGAIDYWFYAFLCGVRPTAPGWETFDVEPCFPEKLMSAQATVDTVKGPVCIRWFRRYGHLTLHVSVPFGTRARIRFAGETHEAGSGFHVYSTPLEPNGPAE